MLLLFRYLEALETLKAVAAAEANADDILAAVAAALSNSSADTAGSAASSAGHSAAPIIQNPPYLASEPHVTARAAVRPTLLPNGPHTAAVAGSAAAPASAAPRLTGSGGDVKSMKANAGQLQTATADAVAGAAGGVPRGDAANAAAPSLHNQPTDEPPLQRFPAKQRRKKAANADLATDAAAADGCQQPAAISAPAKTPKAHAKVPAASKGPRAANGFKAGSKSANAQPLRNVANGDAAPAGKALVNDPEALQNRARPKSGAASSIAVASCQQLDLGPGLDKAVDAPSSAPGHAAMQAMALGGTFAPSPMGQEPWATFSDGNIRLPGSLPSVTDFGGALSAPKPRATFNSVFGLSSSSPPELLAQGHRDSNASLGLPAFWSSLGGFLSPDAAAVGAVRPPYSATGSGRYGAHRSAAQKAGQRISEQLCWEGADVWKLEKPKSGNRKGSSLSDGEQAAERKSAGHGSHNSAHKNGPVSKSPTGVQVRGFYQCIAQRVAPNPKNYYNII